MILNISSRTDIIQYYTPWLLNRFKEGFVYARNPLYPNKITRYELNPKMVDCIVFCSKNYEPVLENLSSITDKFNTYFNYTITAYDKDIEPNVPNINTSIETLLKLEKITGSKRIAWRYDPVLLNEKYTIDYHIKTFETMAKKLSGHIDRCIFSFVQMYKKLSLNMPELIPLKEEEEEILAKNFGEIAAKYNILIQTCATKGDYKKYNILSSGCITLDILAKANNLNFKKLKHKGARPDCHCIDSRDIGAYNTCLNGCKYCYATLDHSQAYDYFKKHNPKSPLLIGEVKENDIIQQGNQASFLKDYIQTLPLKFQ